MKKQKLFGTIIFVSSFLCFHSHAATGDVDLSFDPGSGVNGTVNAIAVQPDGKVILGGQFTTVKGLVRTNIARINADGSGDSSFTSGPMDYPVYSLALQPDGKVLVGSEFHNFGLTRVNADGSPDTNFNGNALSAIVASEPYNPVRITSLILQPDGKIIYPGDVMLRLNSSGTRDSSFTGGQRDFVYSMALQSDGKLILGGYFHYPGNVSAYGIARLNPNGSLDNSFDGAAGTNAVFHSIVLQADGKVLIGGSPFSVNGTNVVSVARLNADGTADATFNQGIGNGSTVYAMAVQTDGKIIIGGRFASINGQSRTNLARLNADGGLDPAFRATTDAGVLTIAFAANGGSLIGGMFNTVNGTKQKHIARLHTDGTLDGSLNPG